MISLKPAPERKRRMSPPVATAAADRDQFTELLSDALRRTGYQSLGALHCEATGNGHVVLTGVVRSFYLKQLAQETVRRLAPHDRIDNRVQVQYE